MKKNLKETIKEIGVKHLLTWILVLVVVLIWGKALWYLTGRVSIRFLSLSLTTLYGFLFFLLCVNHIWSQRKPYPYNRMDFEIEIIKQINRQFFDGKNMVKYLNQDTTDELLEICREIHEKRIFPDPPRLEGKAEEVSRLLARTMIPKPYGRKDWEKLPWDSKNCWNQNCKEIGDTVDSLKFIKNCQKKR